MRNILLTWLFLSNFSYFLVLQFPILSGLIYWKTRYLQQAGTVHDFRRDLTPLSILLRVLFLRSITIKMKYFHFQEGLTPAMCRIVNSPSKQHAPLLTVMQYYKLKVNIHFSKGPLKASSRHYRWPLTVLRPAVVTFITLQQVKIFWSMINMLISICVSDTFHSNLSPGMNISPMATYTVIVNCSATNLTSFPSLPSQTTVLDLSHNALTQVNWW